MTSLKEKSAKRKQQKQSKRLGWNSTYLDIFKSAAENFENKDFDSAIKKYTQAIELNYRDYDVYNNRGICYQELENYQAAVEDYTLAINELEKKEPDANKIHPIYNSRGLCYSNLDEYELALNDFNKAIELSPKNYIPYVNLGNCHLQKEQYEVALKYFDKAIELNPNSAVAYNNRCICYINLGKKELALTDYQASTSLKQSEDRITKINFSDKDYDSLIKDVKEKNKALKESEDKLKEKTKELNNLIAMFAHNFLGTLQCIRSNAEHDNNVSIHLKTVKMMSGALTAFSIISADDDKLIEQLKQDKTGETTLSQNLTNNLAHAVSQLLSKTNKDKIINLYLNYLHKTNQIEAGTDSEELRENRDYRKKWQALQHQWEDEFNALFSENVELSRLQTWLETNFFPVQIIGFNDYNIRFKEFGITDSIFLVVFMEILVNALKYMDVSQNQPLTITLCKKDQHYQLTCENPSAQESYRGTHKGMDFLKSIAKKLNGQFITESTEQSFKTTFTIPAELVE